MTNFAGFTDDKVLPTAIPAAFFSELLSQIEDIDELKLSLYAFWYLAQQEGDFCYFTEEIIAQDSVFMAGFGAEAHEHLLNGLKKALERGTFIMSQNKDHSKVFYWLNSPRGRAAARLLREGKWNPGDPNPTTLDNQRPNIFRLYEEHIGPLTPIISDTLKDAEDTYPAEWIVEAMRIAVHKNVRNWRYIETILRSWKEKGRHETDRRNSPNDSRKYIEGEFADYIEH